SDAIAALGDRPRALRMQREIHGRALAVYGERDELAMQAATSLAVTLARSGEIKAARALMEKQVPLSTAVSGADSKDTLFAIGSLASMRAMDGDFGSAAELQRGLVATQIRRLGSEHPATLAARGNLVNMLM